MNRKNLDTSGFRVVDMKSFSWWPRHVVVGVCRIEVVLSKRKSIGCTCVVCEKSFFVFDWAFRGMKWSKFYQDVSIGRGRVAMVREADGQVLSLCWVLILTWRTTARRRLRGKRLEKMCEVETDCDFCRRLLSCWEWNSEFPNLRPGSHQDSWHRIHGPSARRSSCTLPRRSRRPSQRSFGQLRQRIQFGAFRDCSESTEGNLTCRGRYWG